MSRLQNLIFCIFILARGQSLASNCSIYEIHGLVKSEKNEIVLILHEGSRSEIKVYLPESLQSLLKNEIGSRVEIHAPAEKKNSYRYQVYFKKNKVNYFPFTTQRRDLIQVQAKQNLFQCQEEK
jgi:hypothetical protein